MASSSSFKGSCVTCFSKHNQTRPSLCRCEHCSQSFCFNCMREHNDEMQQVIARPPNHYNELQELIKTKRKLVTNETVKSRQQINEWFEKYIGLLTAEKARMNMTLEITENEGKKFVSDIEIELHTLLPNIEAMTKTGMFHTENMEQLLKKLDELQQRLSSLTETREYDFPSTVPKYTFKFNYSSKTENDRSSQTSTSLGSKQESESNTADEWLTDENDEFGSDSESSGDIVCYVPFPDENYFSNRAKHEPTSFTVNRLASDGINIMYSSIEDANQERIAYCYLDDEDTHYKQADPSRTWNQSRIVDMIWWESVDRFVCATEKGIYTVQYTDETFRILKVINDHMTQVYVATNTDHIWVHNKGKFVIYNTAFQMIRSTNITTWRPIALAGFCLTDNLVGIALIRRIENNRDLLTIEFYDLEMNRKARTRLGVSESSCIIRTDGNERFYVAVGQQRFYIVSPNGNKQIVNLGKQAGSLAIVNSHSIVLTKSRSDLELVKC